MSMVWNSMVKKGEKRRITGEALTVLQGHTVSRIRALSVIYLTALPVLLAWTFFILRERKAASFLSSPFLHTALSLAAIFWLVFLKRTAGNFSAFGRTLFRIQAALLLAAAAVIPPLTGCDAGIAWLHVIAALLLRSLFPLPLRYIAAVFGAAQVLFSACAALSGRPEFTLKIYLLTALGTLFAAAVSMAHSVIFVRHAEQALLRETGEQTLSPLFFQNPAPSCVYERDTGRLLVCNESFMRLYELTDETAGDVRFGMFESMAEWTKMLSKLADGGNLEYYAVLQTLPNGRKRWYLLRLQNIIYDGIPGVLSAAVSFPEVRMMEKSIAEHAFTDALTGVYNRRKGLECVAAHLAALKENGGTLALCTAEIDNIKKVNEDLGREAGDEYIEIVCRCLQEQTPENGTLFRTAGDAFGIVLSGAGLEEADSYAYKVTDCLFELNRVRGNIPYPLSVTFGAILCDGAESRTPKQLIAAPELRKFRIRTPQCETQNV